MSVRENQLQRSEGEFSLSALTAAAHELKAPLSLIRQLSLVLQDDSLQEQQNTKELLRRITATSERAMRLVTLLTKHARLEDALFELEPVNVLHVCEEVVAELWPLTNMVRRPIIAARAHQHIAVANPELLRAIILGLCDNSFAYALGEQPIRITISQSGEQLRIAVRDFGPTVSRTSFNRLQQALGKTLQPLGGRPQSSGLGLYVAGRFAQAMQGALGVVRHREEGMTFFIDMPQSRQLNLFLS